MLIFMLALLLVYLCYSIETQNGFTYLLVLELTGQKNRPTYVSIRLVYQSHLPRHGEELERGHISEHKEADVLCKGRLYLYYGKEHPSFYQMPPGREQLYIHPRPKP
jgi:hypothetical protein